MRSLEIIIILGDMGYPEKMQRLCSLKGVDQSALADQLGLSRASISRILSGSQRPKLEVAFRLARALGVSLDYLLDDSMEVDHASQLMMVSADELTILKLVRRLGHDVAMDRLLGVDPGRLTAGESNRLEPKREDRGEATRGDRGGRP
ncbi:hypothetical protein BH23PLA1_BH23PLA1_17770 [soil metagenome]